MKNELISVIVPVYNVELFIKRCLDSIISQTYNNLEIILIDDGSTDNSGVICESYKEKDKRIKVFHKKNGGLSDARNFGIDHSKGKYITFIDSDDYIESTYVEYLYKLIKEYNCEISLCTYYVKYDNGKLHFVNKQKKEKYTNEQILEKILYSQDFEVSAWAKMYSSELFKDIRYPYGKIFEDIDTTYKLLDKVKYVACGYEAKYNYMIRTNSITNTFKENHIYMVEATNNMCTYVINKYPNLKNACERRMCYAYISTLDRMLNANYNNKDLLKKYRKEILKRGKIIFDRKVSKRDKLAIICLKIGLWFYKINWNIYRKLTGRS